MVGCGWCTRASSGFLADVSVTPTMKIFFRFKLLAQVLVPARKALAVYPVCLFYALIAWMVLVRTG